MPNTPSASRPIQIGQALCDFDQLTLVRQGELSRLEPRLAGVLAVLVQNAGKTLSRDELLALAWDEGASDEALTQAISRLRKLLGDRQAIETVPRIGYRLVAPVSPAETETMATPAMAGTSSRLLTPSRRRWLGGGVMLTAAATLGAFFALWLFGGTERIEQEFEIQPAQDGEIEFIPQDADAP